MWIPAEIKDPVLQHAPTRKSVACFGAVSLRTGKFVRAMCGVFNAETFEAFLKKLLRHRSHGQRMVVVLDNAKYHHAVMLAPFLRKYRSVLSLLFLPPYSPQLAPIERVWKLARRHFATKAEARIAVFEYIEGWYNPTRRHSSLGRISPIEFERRYASGRNHAAVIRSNRVPAVVCDANARLSTEAG